MLKSKFATEITLPMEQAWESRQNSDYDNLAHVYKSTHTSLQKFKSTDNCRTIYKHITLNHVPR